MGELFAKVAWLLILLPGFLSLGIARLITPLGEFSEFDITILCLAFAAIDGLAAIGVVNVYYRIRCQKVELEDVVRRLPFVFAVTLISLLCGLGIAIGIERDFPTKAARFLAGDEITQVSFRSPLAYLLRNAGKVDSTDFPDGRFDATTAIQMASDMKIESKALRVHMVGNADEQIVGIRKLWGIDTGEAKELYLSPACLQRDGQVCRVAGPGIWLPLSQVSRIDFLDASLVACVQEQLPPVGQLTYSLCQ